MLNGQKDSNAISSHLSSFQLSTTETTSLHLWAGVWMTKLEKSIGSFAIPGDNTMVRRFCRRARKARFKRHFLLTGLLLSMISVCSAGDMGYFRIVTGHNALGIESEVSWATPATFTIDHNFPCHEDGSNCNGAMRWHQYVDPSHDPAALRLLRRRQLRLRSRT